MYWTHNGISEADPAIWPATTDQVKSYGRIDGDDESEEIDTFIRGVSAVIEAMTNRSLVNRTITAVWDKWPSGIIYVPKPPLVSVTSIQYYDSDNALQTLATSSYNVDTVSQPGRIEWANDATLPTLEYRIAAVVITYVGGYGAAAKNVPWALRLAVQAAAADCYEHREMHIEDRVQANPAVTNLIAAYAQPGVG